MTKAKGKIVTDGRQMSLLDLLQQEKVERQSTTPGRLCVSARLLMAVKNAIRQAPKSRDILADELTELTGQTITVAMLNNWTAESHPHRLPAELLPALCQATGCDEPLRVLAETAGLFTLPGVDALRAQIQKLDEQVHELNREKRRHQLFLKEMGA